MTAGPLILLLLPMVASAVAYVLRRWRTVPAWIATGVSLVLGLVLLLLPSDQPLQIGGREILLDQPVNVLGRALVLTPSDRLAMGFLFLTGALLFLLAWRFDRGGLFAPMGLGLLGMFGGVLQVRPLIYAALLLQIAASFSVFPLYAEEDTPARGGLRYLTFFTLALPGLMISHWLLDSYAVIPDQPGLLQAAMVAIGLSFALMLGMTPFHAWVPAVGADGAPLTAAFLYTATSGTVWFLLMDYLQTYPWLTEFAQWHTLLPTVGAATAVVGGLLGTTRRSAGTLMGYAVMVDTGMAVVALGQGTPRGLGIAIGLLFARALGAALIAAGLGELKQRSGGAIELPDGIGREAPWSTLAVFVGGLSLVGFPPTIGFAARWALLSTVFPNQPVIGLVLVLASVGTLAGLLRLVTRLLRRPPSPMADLSAEPEGDEEAAPAPESPINVALLLVFIAATLAFGLFPQWMGTAADQLASFFTFFNP
jgi:formate hydrogenlyase subunit 3/multisubunit Na+/H+ antiporter MnhD subunit